MRGTVAVDLTARELEVLALLIDRADEVVEKGRILDLVWGPAFRGDPNIVEVYISQLRRKVDHPFGEHRIETVRPDPATPRRLRGARALVATLALLAGCGGGSGPAEDAAPSLPVATSAPPTPPKTAAPVANWASYGRDLANTRTNTAESAVTAATVGDLAVGWSTKGLVGVTGTPSVVDGVAYFGDWNGVVWAVDASTGAERWQATIGGWVVGAPAVADGRVYASSGHTLFSTLR